MSKTSNKSDGPVAGNELLRKGLNKHKETNGNAEHPEPKKDMISKIEVVEEVQQPEEIEPKISEESYTYKPPYQVPHRNDNKNFRPEANIKDISRSRGFSPDSSSSSPERRPDKDMTRRRRPLISDTNAERHPRTSRGRVRDIVPEREPIFTGSRATTQRAPTRSNYVDQKTLDRFSKPADRYSAGEDREEKPVASKPIRIAGRRSESKWQGKI